MSFLDNLLTLKNPLEEGQQLLTFPRTWRSHLPWNTQPFCYKAHKTKGGLYVVLPHHHDGSLFLKHPKKEFVQTPHAPYAWIDNIFFLQQTFAGYKKDSRSREKQELILSSKVARSNISTYPQAVSTVSFSYEVTEKAVPRSLHIEYGLVLDHYFFTKAQFDIYKNLANGRAYAVGPKVITNVAPFEKSPLIDHEATLENLVELISLPEFKLDDFFHILNFAY